MRIIILGLIIMAALVVVVIISVVSVHLEKKHEKKRRECAFMCKRTVREGLCPHCCEKCAWGDIYEH